LLLLVSFALSVWVKGVDGETDILTPEERQWLEDHPEIRLAANPVWPVVEFRDDEGNWIGMIPDYISLVEEKLGIQFEVIQFDIWEEAMEKGLSKEIEVFPDLMETPERSEYLLFTTPYAELSSVIIVRKDVEGSLIVEDLIGLRVAVVSGQSLHEYLASNYPQMELVLVPDPITGLRQVSMGVVDAYAGDAVTASYFTQTEVITNLRIAGNVGYTFEISIACRNDLPELNAILQKAVDAIDEEDIQAIYDKWIRLAEEPSDTWKDIRTPLFAAIGGIVAVFLGAITWTRMLRKQVKQRTSEMEYELKERKQAEIALRESEDKFRSLVETTSDWIWEMNQDGIYTYSSPKIKELLGYEPEEIIGKTPFDLMPPDEAKRVGVIFGEIVASHRPIESLENMCLHKDGHTVLLESSGVPIFDSAGNFTGYRGIDRDITERKKAEEALLQYKHIVSSSTDMLAILDTSFTYLAANDSYVKAFNVTIDDLIGHTVSEIFGEEFFQTVIKLNADRCMAGEVINYQEWFDFPAYEPRYMSINYYPYLSDSNIVKGFVVNGRDSTERKRAEEALRESEEKFRMMTNCSFT
jgi:PAS domain S-box-containing protein